MKRLEIDYQLALSPEFEVTEVFVPSEAQCLLWLEAALDKLKEKKPVSLTVRLVGLDEIQQLNRDYRQKDYATNVLSFPFEKPPGVVEDEPFDYLGDLIICADVVEKEAVEQKKDSAHHWAHMLVHGCLHLYGFDHIEDAEADEMESLEVDILHTLDITSPY